jgi:hypothetical protein
MVVSLASKIKKGQYVQNYKDAQEYRTTQRKIPLRAEPWGDVCYPSTFEEFAFWY